MQRRHFGIALYLLVCSSVAWARSNKNAENAFRDSVAQQQLVLRNFSGEDKVHAVWTGTAMAFDQPRWRTLGILNVNSAKITHGELRLMCSRHVLMRDSNDKLALSDSMSTVEIDIDLKGDDPGQVLPQLKDRLFYSSPSEAIAALPKQLQRMLPARTERVGPQRVSQNGTCDCDERNTEACAGRNPKLGMTPPQPLYTADPEYSEEARRAGINGSVEVDLIIDETGKPKDIWLASPAGYGLDESAVDATRQYVFRPAMCHGTPVSTAVMVAVRFNIYHRWP